MLNDLQNFKMDDDHWRKMAYDASKRIAQKEAQTKSIITYSNENSQTRFMSDATLNDTEAIMHTIYAYSHYLGKEPTLDEIEAILARSGHALETSAISKRLHTLKSTNLILASKRLLTSTAVGKLKRKFAIIIQSQ
jgi:hypothetical protein